MIYGRLVGGKATVSVIFRLPEQPDFSLDFIIDTGFNGYLTLVHIFKMVAIVGSNYNMA